MSIILLTEKKNFSIRILYACMYLILAVGALSMVYPFLLMVSGSMKSRIDENEFNIVPTYLHDESMLFRKQIESKYNENLQLYLQSNGDQVFNFRNIEMPTAHKPALVTDWIEFNQTNLPLSWFVIGYGPTGDGKIIQRNEREFRNYIKEVCNNDLTEFSTRFGEPLENWFFLKFQSERLLDRTFLLNRTELFKNFYEFKSKIKSEDRIFMSAMGAYSKFLKQTGAEAEVLKKKITSPSMERWVRTILHPQFVNFSSDGLSHWNKFLVQKYQKVEFLNKLYNTTYESFDEVPLPTDRIYSSPQVTDYMLFISDKKNSPAEFISLTTPEFTWQEFLIKKYGSLEKINAAHDRDFSSIQEVRMPQKEFDYAMVIKNKSDVKSNFLTRNFTMVFEYVLLYGKGLSNTVVYCLLSIVLSLLVNPIAAYALSRYKLQSQFKILLFLIATMAFPAVVTMIPNFLLLRDLGLLNTFAALLLPSMANGYSIFLLKGFFDSLPRELYEAADIDGASEWNKFWMITMNLSKPILAVIALGAFNGAYSNFMFAFILCQDREMWTLMVWLYQLQQFSSQGVVFASLLVAAVPTLLIFIFCQNLIIKGIVVPTEK
ncbi:Sugar permease [Lentisphaera araneosa HTCC2155]|uniref:sn-glycerol-3-phosphate transport system permease protein UgpE n=1 Tax=Lentisphaera araneosa HTCC2155 TaxID=313628 RepID=A6DJT7_9BACT|nr:carbohydrate ABC transporter permease [Lentisphaera araneosa]EDM28161.1 Sugar permease [Lentisphaera araneosa HTCC2155]